MNTTTTRIALLISLTFTPASMAEPLTTGPSVTHLHLDAEQHAQHRHHLNLDAEQHTQHRHHLNLDAEQHAQHPHHQSHDSLSMHSQQHEHYACPMHPDETSHKPGRCAKCNMFLVKTQPNKTEDEDPQKAAMHTEHHIHHHGTGADVNTEAMPLHLHNDDKPLLANNHLKAESSALDSELMHNAPHSEAHKEIHHASDVLSQAKPAPLNQEATYRFVCPMHPHIISDEAGSCPICGMDLERVAVGGTAEQGIEVEVSGAMQQALAIKVVKAKKETLWKFIPTVGQVDYDQSQIAHVHARVSGWIEKLSVTAVGDKVKKGQLLYEIYSPELINAQDDYLLANETYKQSKDPRYQDLVKRAGTRLELLGMTKQQINQLSKNSSPLYRVPFYAKQDGIIKALSIREGMYIEPMTEMMSIVDIAKVWVIADVFENEQSWLKPGQEAEISIPAMDLKAIQGKVDYIYPELDPITRSLRVRIVIPNQQAKLRPNTLAKISIFGGPERNVLAIPQEALIQTGKNNRVIIKTDDNHFTAREVKVGMMSQGKAQIIQGLKEDDQVVVSGQFLLDSEASLKGSLMRLSHGHQH